MGILIQKKLHSNALLGVWKIEENEEWYFNHPQLTDRVRERIEDYKSLRRKLQGIATRVLIKALLPNEENVDLTYDEKRKPHFLSLPYKLSISHSGPMVAVLLSDQGEVGVDVERYTGKVERVAHKFMNHTESEIFQKLENQARSDYSHVIWGAKECMYKLYGKGSVNFKQHLLIDPFNLEEDGVFNGRIAKDSRTIEVSGNYIKGEHFILVYVQEA